VSAHRHRGNDVVSAEVGGSACLAILEKDRGADEGLAIGGVVDKAADGSGFVRLGRHQRGQEGDGPNAVAGSIQKSAVHRPSSHLNPSFVSPTDQLPGYVHRLCTHLT